MKLLDALKAANAGRNRQQHRIVPGTKAARQHVAQTKDRKNSADTGRPMPSGAKAPGGTPG